MTTQQILEAANMLSKKLAYDEVKKDYIEQIFRYVLDQQKRKSEMQCRTDLRKLVSNMPKSGFEKRTRSTEAQYKNAVKILEAFRIQGSQNPFLDISLDDITKILGWTVKLMKYNEAEKGDN